MAAFPMVTDGTVSFGLSATNYYPIGNSSIGSFGTPGTESQQQIKIQTAGYFFNLTCRVSTNANTGTSTARFRKNTANGNSVISIASSTTGEFQDLTNTDQVARTDLVCFQFASGASGSSLVLKALAIAFAGEKHATFYTLLSGATISTASVSFFFPIAGNGNAPQTVEAARQFKAEASTNLRNMQANIASNSRSTASTIGLRKNATTITNTLSITASTSGIFQDTTHVDAIVATDLINYFISTGTGTGSTVIALINIESDGQNFPTALQLSTYANTVVISPSTTIYNSLGGDAGQNSTTESDMKVKALVAGTLNNLQLYLATNTITNAGTMNLRKNGANSTLTLSITASTTGRFEDANPAHAVSVLPSDDFDYQIVAGTTGTNMSVSSMGCLFECPDRLWDSGFEQNSTNEFTATTACSIVSTQKRSGTYALQVSATDLAGSTPVGYLYHFVANNLNTRFYARAYIYITSAPGAANVVFVISDNATIGTLGNGCWLQLNTNRTISFIDNSLVTVGTSAAAIALNTWAKLEIMTDNVNQTTQAWLDDVSIGSATGSGNTAALSYFKVGGNFDNGFNSSGNWYFDDLAVNKNTPTGSGKIIRLYPSAAGDANTFATQTGGTAGAANNFTRVNEVTPDDATTFNGSNTAGQEDIFDFPTSGVGATDTINFVSLSSRFRNSVADTSVAAIMEIEKASAGKKYYSQTFVPNTTTWNTDNTVDPHNPLLVLPVDPDGNAWTQTTVDGLQAGYKIMTAGTNRIDFTQVYVQIDYIPASSSTNWTQTLTETITSSDTIINLLKKVLTESEASTDAIIKMAHIVKSEAQGSSDALVRQANKVLAETQAQADTISILVAHILLLTETQASSDTIVKMMMKLLTEAQSSSDTAAKLVGILKTETITNTDSIAKKPLKTFTETQASSDAITKTPGKALTESQGSTDVLVKMPKLLKTESLSSTDSRTMIPKIVKTESITATDTIATSILRLITLLESIASADTIVKQPGKMLTETQATADVILKLASILRLETITDTDSLLKAPNKKLTDSVASSDSLLKQPNKVLAESQSSSDAIVKQAMKLLLETLTDTDTIAKKAMITKTEAITSSDAIATLLTHLLTLVESIAQADTIIKQAQKKATESIASADVILKYAQKVLTDSITSTDTISMISGKLITLSESISSADTILKKAMIVRPESLASADTIIKQMQKSLTESQTSTDTIVKQARKLLTEIQASSDAITKMPKKALTESLTETDSLTKSVQKILIESILDSDTIQKLFSKTMLETILSTDTISKLFPKLLIETIATTDVVTPFLRPVLMKLLVESVALSDRINLPVLEWLVLKLKQDILRIRVEGEDW